MSATLLIDVPDQAGLDSVEIPRLLAQAWKARRSGLLQLDHDGIVHNLLFRRGNPVGFEDSAQAVGFARFLEARGEIDAAQRESAEYLARERPCAEASAVMGLKLLDAPALYRALRAQAQLQIAESLSWESGLYRWLSLPASQEGSTSQTKPHDGLGLLQAELPKRWGLDRLFSSLIPVQEVCGGLDPACLAVTQRLATAGRAAEQALTALGRGHSVGRVLGDCAGDPLAASTLWVTVHSGLLRVSSAPTEPKALDFEVEVAPSTEASPRSASEARSSTRSQSPASNLAPGDAGLREEIVARLEELADLDHYTALQIDREASASQIKKAYFKAAKRYHPDALVRLDLADSREDAARLFARIAEAFEILSDPVKRQAYDQDGQTPNEVDTAQLAQAETSFRKGEVLAKMGNFEGALDYLGPAVELWPEEPAYQAALGWALYKQRRPDLPRATTHLELALASSPEDPVLLYRLGRVLRAAGDSERSAALLARAGGREHLDAE